MIPGPIHPDRPEINGFCFSELAGFSAVHADAMARTGAVWVTEFRARGHDGVEAVYGGNLIAVDRGAAEEEAKRRGLGETVKGRLEQVVERR